MKKILSLLIFALITSPAHADRCWLTGGCEGRVGYMHLTSAQMESDDIFIASGLPNVNDIVEIKGIGSFFDPRSVSDQRFESHLAAAIEDGQQLPWGGQLRTGSLVRILGYETFAHLEGRLGNELFLLVLVTNVE